MLKQTAFDPYPQTSASLKFKKFVSYLPEKKILGLSKRPVQGGVSEILCANRRIRRNNCLKCTWERGQSGSINESEAVPQRTEGAPPGSESFMNGKRIYAIYFKGRRVVKNYLKDYGVS